MLRHVVKFLLWPTAILAAGAVIGTGVSLIAEEFKTVYFVFGVVVAVIAWFWWTRKHNPMWFWPFDE